MADNEAAVLEQAQTLQRAKQMQAQLQKRDPAQPGVAAIGSPDGLAPKAPQEADWVDKASDLGGKIWENTKLHHPLLALTTSEPAKQIQGLVGRAMNYPVGLAATGIAQAIGALKKGPNPIGLGDWAQAAIPFVGGPAPGLGDRLEQVGVNQPQDGISIPGTNKKLSAKAIENALGSVALNPLSYKGFNEWAGRKMYNSAIKPIEVQGEKFGKDAVGDELNKQGIWNPLNITKKIQPIVDSQMETAGKMEQQATAAGGSPVMKKAMAPAQEYVNNILKNAKPGSSQEKMAEAMQKEIDLHLQMDAKAAQKAFVELPYTEQTKSLEYAGPNPEDELHLAAGTKGPSLTSASNGVAETIPGGPVQQNEVIHRLDAKGKPIVNTKPLQKMPDARVIESDPTKLNPDGSGGHYEINRLPVQGNYDIKTTVAPKLEVGEAMQEPDLAFPSKSQVRPGATPIQGAQWKKDAYGNATNSAYNTETRNTPWQGFYKVLGHGLKGAVEDSIGQGLGPEAEAQYRANNESTGKLLSTGKAQIKVQNQAGRDLDRMLDPTAPTDMLASAAGGHGELDQMLKVGSIMKAIRAARLLKMPVGYALRNADSGLMKSGIAGDALNQSPWLIKGDNNGEK